MKSSKKNTAAQNAAAQNAVLSPEELAPTATTALTALELLAGLEEVKNISTITVKSISSTGSRKAAMFSSVPRGTRAESMKFYPQLRGTAIYRSPLPQGIVLHLFSIKTPVFTVHVLCETSDSISTLQKAYKAYSAEQVKDGKPVVVVPKTASDIQEWLKELSGMSGFSVVIESQGSLVNLDEHAEPIDSVVTLDKLLPQLKRSLSMKSLESALKASAAPMVAAAKA